MQKKEVEEVQTETSSDCHASIVLSRHISISRLAGVFMTVPTQLTMLLLIQRVPPGAADCLTVSSEQNAHVKFQ